METVHVALEEGAAVVCVPVECTDIRTAAKESCKLSVLNVQSGQGHLHLGMAAVQDGSFHCTNCYVSLYYLTFIITMNIMQLLLWQGF